MFLNNKNNLYLQFYYIFYILATQELDLLFHHPNKLNQFVVLSTMYMKKSIPWTWYALIPIYIQAKFEFWDI